MKLYRRFLTTGLPVAVALFMLAIAIGCSDAGDSAGLTDLHVEEGRNDVAQDSHDGHDHDGQHVVDGSADQLDWCAEHEVPESECTQCHPQLIERFKATGDWCAGHDLPESHCRLCNPGITFPQEKSLQPEQIAFDESEIEISLMFRPNSEVCATDGAVIQFASSETAQRAGIKTAAALSAERTVSIEAPAEVVFNESRKKVVSTTVAAMITRWMVEPGEVIVAGQPLAILRSPEIARLQADLLSAGAKYRVQLQELDRHQELRQADLVSIADYDQVEARAQTADAELASVRGLLLAAGLGSADIERIISTGKISSEFTLRSRSQGLLVERVAQLGDLQEAGKALAVLADPKTMWVEAQLSESQLHEVVLGQPLLFTSDGYALNQVAGRVIWISNFLDPRTRTGTVRAELVDGHQLVRAGELGRVRISRPTAGEATLVPKDAVQWEGCCNVVFVKESALRYRPRKVVFDRGQGPFYQVLEGIHRGDEVVVEGAFLLKTELKKSSIGAGCCGLEPIG